MVTDFSVGKIKVSLAKGGDEHVVVEYLLDGNMTTDKVQVSDFMAFLRGMYESLKGFKVEDKLDPEKHFDRETVEKLKGIGIKDFEYISRDLR